MFNLDDGTVFAILIHAQGNKQTQLITGIGALSLTDMLTQAKHRSLFGGYDGDG